MIKVNCTWSQFEKKNTHAGVENSKSRHQVGTKALFELDFIQVYSIQRGKDHLDRKLTAFPANLDDKSYLTTRVSKRDTSKYACLVFLCWVRFIAQTAGSSLQSPFSGGGAQLGQWQATFQSWRSLKHLPPLDWLICTIMRTRTRLKCWDPQNYKCTAKGRPSSCLPLFQLTEGLRVKCLEIVLGKQEFHPSG